MQTNTQILQRGSKIGRAKKKQKQNQIKEITWDNEKRRDYLTGFHKRKVERKKKAEEKFKERQRLEKLEKRRMKREAVKRHLESLGNVRDIDDDLDLDLETPVSKEPTTQTHVKNAFKTTVTIESL